MHIPFLPRTEVELVLEDEYHEQESYGEFLAEQGSSYFFGGMTSADATFMASQDAAERQAEFEATPEGEEYLARLEVARLFTDVRNLEVLDFNVPEFFPANWPLPYTVPTPHGFVEPVRYDDIPF